ncbi:Hypothetical protein, putative [Bodo saltans]|uniref:Uncharacterized protein n=1 Tax=Bodo saltans TaxID=75058 RepID=A0A0S4IRZ8_BODSA|nr:Hypothetical protein, putative [Bodo saltans]|eukprot:CUF57223.1 Hypothetical protein, putative [Bodo saltans]
MTHRIQIGKERPHKKLILLVDREPYEKDMKQSIRLLTEPLSPTDDAPHWDALSGETEDEFRRRIQAEDASMGKLLPDEDLILTFHCKRGPITTQAVSIIRHYALPIGDFFIELQDDPILKQASRERSLLDVIRNLAKGKKTAKPVALNSVARQKLAEAEEAGEEIYIPDPVQAPRLGGTKKVVPGVVNRTVTEEDVLPDVKEGVTMRHIESQAKLRRQKERIARQIAGTEVVDDDYDDLQDDELIDHLPEYTFDEPDPEDVEAIKNRKRQPQRPALEDMEFPSESDGLEESEESDGRTKRKLKTDKKGAKRAKKEQERKEKERLKKEERAKRKESKERLAAAIEAREQERLQAGYRYSLEYTDNFTDNQPEALYRARSNKKGVPLFKIRAPADEDSLALTSLCFYRRNMVILLNPAMAPDDEESVSVAIASAGQFLVCRPHSNQDDDNDLGASGRGFPLNAVTKCCIEYSNRYVNDQRIGYVTLTIDVNMNPKKAKKRAKRIKEIKKRLAAKEKRKEQRQKQREKMREQRRRARGGGGEDEYDENGNLIDDDDDAFDEEEEEEEDDFENRSEERRREKAKKKKRRDDDDYDDEEGEERDDYGSEGSDETATEDEDDLRTVEMEFDDISCGDMNPDDAECCSLEYFVTVLKHFSPDVKVVTEEPPPEREEEPEDEPYQNMSMTSSEYAERVPASAILAERLVSTASLRAGGREGFTPPEERPNFIGGGGGTFGLLNRSNSQQNSSNNYNLHRDLAAAGGVSTSRLTSLTPQAIQQRGEELRKMISDHKLSQQRSSGEAGQTQRQTAEEATALSRQRTQQHQALTKLIFEISEKNLSKLRRRAAAAVTVGTSPSSTHAASPPNANRHINPQTLMRFREREEISEKNLSKLRRRAAAAVTVGTSPSSTHAASPPNANRHINPQTLMRFREREAHHAGGSAAAHPLVVGGGQSYPLPGMSRIVPQNRGGAVAPSSWRRPRALSSSSQPS